MRLIVIGAGGFGRAVAEAAELAGHAVAGFVDDRWPELAAIWAHPVVGRVAHLPSLRELAPFAVVAIGDNTARGVALDRAASAGFELATIIHPAAVVSPRAVIGRGVSVMAGAIVGTEARLDDGAIVNAGAVLDHHAQVRRLAHVGVGARMAGGAVLDAGAWLKEGAVLAAGQHVAAGAVVSR